MSARKLERGLGKAKRLGAEIDGHREGLGGQGRSCQALGLTRFQIGLGGLAAVVWVLWSETQVLRL